MTLDTIDPAAPAIALTSDDGASSTDKITTNGALTLTGVEERSNGSILDRWRRKLDVQFHSCDRHKHRASPADGCSWKPRVCLRDFTFTLNRAPTDVALSTTVGQILETQSMLTRLKVADITVTDDGVGTNALAVTGADAARFEIVGSSLYLRAGTALNFNTKSFYDVAVTVNDATVGLTPDDTSPNFRLTVQNVDRNPTVFRSLRQPHWKMRRMAPRLAPCRQSIRMAALSPTLC